MMLTTGSSPRTLRQNNTTAPAGRSTDQKHDKKVIANTPPHSVQPEDACEDESIYTLPGPINTACQNSRTDSVTYYNCPPLRDSQPFPQGSGNETTLLVTGASNTSKKPVPAPKPKRGKTSTGIRHVYSVLLTSVISCIILIITEKHDDSASSADDYSSTYSYSSTGDSGFSDSLAFRKDPPAPNLCQQPHPKDVTDPDSTYASLIKTQVKSADYYKSLNRENIPGTKLGIV